MSHIARKIKSLDEAVQIVKKLKSANKKVVLGHGVFDLLHYGHINYLIQAKGLGDTLVVSVVVDRFVKKGPGRPVFNEKIRARSLAALECVDYVVPCNNYGPWDIITALRPDAYAKGDDSIGQLANPSSGLNKDKKLIESVGGELCFTKSLPFHSTDILRNSFNTFDSETEQFLREFKKKHPVPDVLAKLESLKNMRVLVIGETIIDEYRFVSPLNKANKAHIISAQYLKKEEFAGGALACANHVAGFCKKVDLVTYLGAQNSRVQFVKAHLKPNIKPFFFFCPGQPTIVKRRFVDQTYYTKLFEECILDKNYLPRAVEQKIETHLKNSVGNYDLVIVTDYGHGFLSKKLIDIISKKARFLSVNTQTNSGNSGFNYITKYPQAHYVCIDEAEARLATQDNFGDMENILKTLVSRLGVRKAIITVGHRGSIGYERNLTRGKNREKTQRNGSSIKAVPSFAFKVTDPVGAGDAFMAVSSPCAAAGFPIELVSFVGNVAGSIALSILGNKSSVERDELFRHINHLLE